MFKVSGLVVIMLFCTRIIAQPWEELTPLLPKGSQVSYLVIDANTKSKIASFQAETLRTPASVQKLLTATTAKLYLGKDYYYQTTIKGDPTAINHGVYHGDLSLHFSGDPTLTRLDIKRMLRTLKAAGIKKITGDFLLNDSHFNGYQWSNGQAWNDLGVCYTAPANAIIVNKNCVLGNLSVSKSDTQKAKLFIPSYEPVDITSDVSVVSKAQRKASFCALELTRNSQNQYHLWGCMVPRKRAFGLSFAVNDPGFYAQQIVANELQEEGIELTGEVRVDSRAHITGGQVELAAYHSPLLDELLQEMMKDSDNLIADSLFKTIGARYFEQPGNYRNGAQAMKAILKAQGVDLENAYIADGSGLSRHNLMSVELFMSVMQFVYAQDKILDLISSFSIAGIDGTLQYHKGVNSPVLKGKVIAKTGSLKGVANLVGVVKADTGDRLFVLMVNGYNLEDSAMDAEVPRHQDASVYRFEKAFFKKVLQ